MTRQEAIDKLRKTGDISTSMLKPLNLDFEFFLTYAQTSKKAQKIFNKAFIQYNKEKYGVK